MKLHINKSWVELTQGDITESSVEAIVNAANSDLALGAGVAGAIRIKGGPSIQEECDILRHCPVGQAVVTGAGQLNTKYVIHAVGPRRGEDDAEDKLQGATLHSLKRADEYNIQSIAFPAISTGVFGFPVKACARIMLETVIRYLKGNTGITLVRFCLFETSTFEVFSAELKKSQV